MHDLAASAVGCAGMSHDLDAECWLGHHDSPGSLGRLSTRTMQMHMWHAEWPPLHSFRQCSDDS